MSQESISKITATSKGRVAKKLSHRQPLPRRWDKKLSHLIDVAARPLVRASVYLSILALCGVFVSHLYSSDRFRLESIRVHGVERLTEEQVAAVLLQEGGIDPGISMFSYSAGHAAEAIERLPAIREVRATKVWPRALELEISERRATALYVSGNGTYVVDETGLLFAQATAEDLRSLEGPVIGGWDSLHLERGSRIPEKDFEQLISELDVVRKASASLYRNLSEARWQPEEGLTLVLADGAMIKQGFLPMSQAGPIIETILADGNRPGQVLDYVRLTRERSVAVAWRPAPMGSDLLMAEKN
ncbi:FtsQ-type POTRA domain-containing protein [bacterium]|nr:FtsQ-type POTRA domain-containing protein [bacterium]